MRFRTVGGLEAYHILLTLKSDCPQSSQHEPIGRFYCSGFLLFKDWSAIGYRIKGGTLRCILIVSLRPSLPLTWLRATSRFPNIRSPWNRPLRTSTSIAASSTLGLHSGARLTSTTPGSWASLASWYVVDGVGLYFADGSPSWTSSTR